MATTVILPKLGNSVESSIVLNWLKQVGDRLQEGEPLCEVETDKAVLEVESPASGTLLAVFFEAGDEVPVMTPIAAVGQPGEDVSALRLEAIGSAIPNEPTIDIDKRVSGDDIQEDSSPVRDDGIGAISPRARMLAERNRIDLTEVKGSGPAGRIIERDILAALAAQPHLTPVAQAMVESGDFVVPPQGGHITKNDLIATSDRHGLPLNDTEVIPVKGVRRVIARRMLESVQTTAQLTLNTSADARQLLAYREKLESRGEQLDLSGITINDLLLYVVSRTLPQHSELNAHFTEDEIRRYERISLGFAVDTPRGLLVPIIHDAHALSLKQISEQAKRLAEACVSGRVVPDELSGGTFTVTNLGALGIENFTPILDPPQVAILGVGSINLKTVSVDGGVDFVPHIGLSLTINHQAVDGAPGARFLHTLSENLSSLDLILAI